MINDQKDNMCPEIIFCLIFLDRDRKNQHTNLYFHFCNIEADEVHLGEKYSGFTTQINQFGGNRYAFEPEPGKTSVVKIITSISGLLINAERCVKFWKCAPQGDIFQPNLQNSEELQP